MLIEADVAVWVDQLLCSLVIDSVLLDWSVHAYFEDLDEQLLGHVLDHEGVLVARNL